MNRRLQKGWIISTVIVLGLTTTLPSVNLVFAETVDETQNSEAEALSLPYDNLLESASRVESSVTQEPVIENEEPIFSFKQEEMTGVVGESTNAVILVDQSVDQVQVTIPVELEVSLDELPNGMEAKQMTDTLWWFSSAESKEFSIPLVSHSAGEYGLQIEDQIEGTITFEESENQPNEGDSTITSKVADAENEPVTSEVQEEEEAVKQETEDITPATTSNVSTWEQFRTAINTNSVTVINVNANVSGNTSLNNIDRNLTINGNGNTIYPQDQFFRVDAGRQITVRNASFQVNDSIIEGSLFRADGPNISFIFSDVRYWNRTTLVGANSSNFPENVSVLFDRGTSTFSGGEDRPIVSNIDHVRIANGASVDLQERGLLGAQSLQGSRANNSSFTVDSGGRFTGRNNTRFGSIVNGGVINIQGTFETEGLATAIYHNDGATAPITITFGGSSRVRMKTTGPTSRGFTSTLPPSTRGIVLNIARGADFDLISQNGSVVDSGKGATSTINTANLAVWNLGQSSNILPNLNFENLEAQMSGTNSATITSTNHTAFRNHYSQQGLAGYSRISSTGIAEQTLSLEASPSAGGRPSADRTSMVPTASTNIRANPNAGYNFVRWEVVSGAGTIANSNSENTTFTMGSSTSTINATIRAVYEPIPVTYTLQLQASPTAGGSPQATSMSLVQGASTAISARPNSGYRFLRWEIVSGGGSIANTGSENTTFTMGSANATIRAVYEEIPVTYTLQLEASPVVGGNPEADAGDLIQGETTAISANPNNGFRFVEWKILSGGGQISDKDAENTEFTMGSANTVLQAVFESEQPSVVNPLDPLDPEIEVNPENRPELPENQGLLSVDFISQFDFGKHTISVQEQTYYAKSQRLLDENGMLIEGEERPNYVQVSDRRSPSDRIGWQLSVTQDKQFENEQGNELTGAEIQFKNQQLVSPQNGKAPGLEQPNMVSLVPGEKQALLTAQEDSGTGTWIYRFGDADSASESVSLTIPSGTVPQASAYNTTFVWELSSVPENSGH